MLAVLVAFGVHQLDTGRRPPLNETQFHPYLLDVLVAVVTAPMSIGDWRTDEATLARRFRRVKRSVRLGQEILG